MYEFDEALYETADGVGRITLNRPQKLNAMSPRIEQDLKEALRQARDDDHVRFGVLQANGRGFFFVDGAALKQFGLGGRFQA